MSYIEGKVGFTALHYIAQNARYLLIYFKISINLKTFLLNMYTFVINKMLI